MERSPSTNLLPPCEARNSKLKAQINHEPLSKEPNPVAFSLRLGGTTWNSQPNSFGLLNAAPESRLLNLVRRSPLVCVHVARRVTPKRSHVPNGRWGVPGYSKGWWRWARAIIKSSHADYDANLNIWPCAGLDWTRWFPFCLTKFTSGMILGSSLIAPCSF